MVGNRAHLGKELMNYDNILLRHNYILLRHNYISVPMGEAPSFEMSRIATVAMNLSYYGFSVDAAAMKRIMSLNDSQLEGWWERVEPQLKSVTGDDRNMADFVVYKNFPAEVLEKTEGEYWFNQILMYWGLPNELFTQEVKPREGMAEQPKLTVLRLSKGDETRDKILASYVSQAARWKQQEQDDVMFLSASRPVNFGSFGFKENLVALAKSFIRSGKKVNVRTGTDVLRLAAGMSDGDVSLREKVKFSKFNRKTRRFFLDSLENCGNLGDDAARRPEVWKRFLKCLHPFDYKARYPKVCEVADNLYKGNLTTFASLVEGALADKDTEALDLLESRPGEYRRRLVHCMNLFGSRVVDSFAKVLPKLTVAQLVSTHRFLESASSRKTRIFPPKGNWTKMQIAEGRAVNEQDANIIRGAIGKELSTRVPKVKMLDIMCEHIKLPSNDGEVSPYARGTVFPIPDGVDFIRTASYWEHKSGYGNIWFDNGWNFFGEGWEPAGTCCWNDTDTMKPAAAFSGDPTNSKDSQGRACQLIDLRLEELRRKGVRYAVWNVLCFSGVPFSQAEAVYAALQWGEDAQSGKLFEPSRAQLSFPLAGDGKTKFVCYIDLQTREMVYMDANLKGAVQSATQNVETLKVQMPAFVEYLNSLPSVYDLFQHSVDESEGNGYIVYSDKDVELKDCEAYVFRPENEANSYKELNINALLG